MTVFITRRVIQLVLIAIIICTIIFFAVNVIGNPVEMMISPLATAEDRAEAIRQLGLDQPVWRQYLIFWQNILHFDFGQSFIHSRPAMAVLFERLPATLELAIFSMALASLIGMPLGISAGYWHDRGLAHFVMGFSILTLSMPVFWIALLLILFFSVELGWLPSTGRGATVSVLGIPLSILTLDGLRHIILPGFTLALFNVATVIRLSAAGVREVITTDYYRFARAKGLSTWRLMTVHVFKSILVPVVTVLGMEFATTIAGAVVTETIFAWPGIGRLIIESITALDRPMIITYVIFIVMAFGLINLLVDLFYLAIDPRARNQG